VSYAKCTETSLELAGKKYTLAGRLIRSLYEFAPGKIIIGFNESGYCIMDRGNITRSIRDPCSTNTLCRGFVPIKNPEQSPISLATAEPDFVIAVNKTHINLVNLYNGTLQPLIEDTVNSF